MNVAHAYHREKMREPSRRKIPWIDFKDLRVVPAFLSSDCICMRYGSQKVLLEVASSFVAGGLFRIPAPP